MEPWKDRLKDKKKRKKLINDFIGIGCGVFLVLVALVAFILSRIPASAGVRDSEVPAGAVTLTGTAPGRNGDITVSLVLTEDRIYQIKVLEQTETSGIGSVAIEKLPVDIFQAQSLKVDATSGATITSDGIKAAIVNALETGGIQPAVFGGSRVKMEQLAMRVETGSGITVMSAQDWSEEYPEIYQSWMDNQTNSDTTDYLEDYPMLPVLYDDYGFARFYSSARGHFYTVTDVSETGRPHNLANCFTCKTPDYTAMVNEMGDAAYSLFFSDVMQEINEPISCYNCHANTPGEITVTHSYLIDAVGEDFENIDAGILACGQCHVEYYFNSETKATTLPYSNMNSMSPDEILAYYNDGSNFPDGQPFADYTNPRTGVRQIKVQHPELETFLGEGSQHRATYTCADCHMADAVSEEGVSYKSHTLISPLDNPELIESECSTCHVDLVAEVKAVQEETERRTYAIGYQLEYLTERLAAAVESGEYTEAQLEAIRALARDAQFYWDFVFVENSEGAHNPTLTKYCLDTAEQLTTEALLLFKR